MRRFAAIGSAIALLVLVGSIALASGSAVGRRAGGWGRSTTHTSAAASAATDEGTLVVISRRPKITTLDLGAEGFSAGDIQAVTAPVYEPGGTKVIGGLDVNLLVTLFNGRRERDELTLTTRLPEDRSRRQAPSSSVGRAWI